MGWHTTIFTKGTVRGLKSGADTRDQEQQREQDGSGGSREESVRAEQRAVPGPEPAERDATAK